MSRESILKQKSFDFAIRIVNLYKFLKTKQREYIISQQLFRSGTAIGAIIREAEHAKSRKDLSHKLSIGLKEANESIYWLGLLFATKYINKKMFDSMINDVTELLKMLIASVISTKSRTN